MYSHSSSLVRDRYQSVKLLDPKVSKDSINNERPPLQENDTSITLSKVIVLIIPKISIYQVLSMLSRLFISTLRIPDAP